MANFMPAARDQRLLCLRSGNRCALSDCRKLLVVAASSHDREVIIGEMAHIKGEKPGAARYDANMTDKERNAYANRILVCRDHHKVIDDQRSTYTVDKLLSIKTEHEEWVRHSTETELPCVTFAELSVVTNYLVSAQTSPPSNLTLIPPKEKIQKNSLSASSEQLILIGMTQTNQVKQFIHSLPDAGFGERLKERFVVEYQRLKTDEQLHGDELFEALHAFAAHDSDQFRYRAAGLAVLVYLFELCEVFEK